MSAVEMSKVCVDCGIRKPWSEYHAKLKWPDGTIRSPQSCCKRCQGARSAKWKRDHPEWRRKVRRQEHKRIRRDPERLAILQTRQREWYRRRFNVPPERFRSRAEVVGQHDDELMDVAPFAAWLRTLGSIRQAADATGLLPRQVQRYLDGSIAKVKLDTVDRACIHADKSLDELYPLQSAA